MKSRSAIGLLAVLGAFSQPSIGATCLSASSDPDGDGWGWENGDTCKITDTTRGQQGESIYDPTSNTEYQLTRLQWEWADLAGKSSDCNVYSANRTEGQWTYGHQVIVYFSANGTWADSDSQSGNWHLSNGMLEGVYGAYLTGGNVLFDTYARILDDKKLEFFVANHHDYHSRYGTNLPHNTRFTKYVCNNITPTGNAQSSIAAIGICDDPDGDGWGWNGTTSCKTGIDTPAPVVNSAQCIDLDGDGWGWNGTTSCKP